MTFKKITQKIVFSFCILLLIFLISCDKKSINKTTIDGEEVTAVGYFSNIDMKLYDYESYQNNLLVEKKMEDIKSIEEPVIVICSFVTNGYYYTDADGDDYNVNINYDNMKVGVLSSDAYHVVLDVSYSSKHKLSYNYSKDKNEIKKEEVVLMCWIIGDGSISISIGNGEVDMFTKDLDIEIDKGYRKISYIYNNTIEIDGWDSTGDVVIPDKIFGYPVSTIKENAFLNCKDLTSIVIPKTVTKIGKGAFDGCTSLLKMELPFIGETKDSLKNPTIGFIFGSSYVTNTSVPSNLKEIIVTNAETIGDGAFSGCKNLTSIKLNSNISSIGTKAFFECESIESIVLPDSTTNIGTYAFGSCKNLKNITLPSKLTTIGNNAFNDCIRLENITLPNALTSIGDFAFKNCESLTSITIPSNVTSIGECIYADCNKLEELTVDGNNKKFYTVYGYNVIIEKGTNKLFAVCKGSIIPSNVKIIPTGIFNGSDTLVSIEIPEGVTTIEAKAFYDCTKLESVKIPSTVTSIGDLAFGNCTALRKISVDKNNKIYDSRDDCNAIILTAKNHLIVGCSGTVVASTVTGILDNAFYGSGLTTLTIKKGLRLISENAFVKCDKFNKVYFEGTMLEWLGVYTLSPLFSTVKNKPISVQCSDGDPYKLLFK